MIKFRLFFIYCFFELATSQIILPANQPVRYINSQQSVQTTPDYEYYKQLANTVESIVLNRLIKNTLTKPAYKKISGPLIQEVILKTQGRPILNLPYIAQNIVTQPGIRNIITQPGTQSIIAQPAMQSIITQPVQKIIAQPNVITQSAVQNIIAQLAAQSIIAQPAPQNIIPLAQNIITQLAAQNSIPQPAVQNIIPLGQPSTQNIIFQPRAQSIVAQPAPQNIIPLAQNIITQLASQNSIPQPAVQNIIPLAQPSTQNIIFQPRAQSIVAQPAPQKIITQQAIPNAAILQKPVTQAGQPYYATNGQIKQTISNQAPSATVVENAQSGYAQISSNAYQIPRIYPEQIVNPGNQYFSTGSILQPSNANSANVPVQIQRNNPDFSGQIPSQINQNTNTVPQQVYYQKSNANPRVF